MVFRFWFFLFKKPKNFERSIFWLLWFLDTGIKFFFRINFALKPYGYYFFIIILFSMYMNLQSLKRLPPNFTSVISYKT